MTMENKKGILAKMNTISKGKSSKLVLLGVSVCLLVNFISCGKESPTEPEPPPPPAKTSLQGNVVGLIKGQPINLSYVELSSGSGSVVVECQVSNDKFSNDDINHPLSCTRIRIRSDEAYDRETNLSLQQGMNNIVTLNMIESDNITGFSFEDYKTVGYIGGASPRWKTYVPKFYIYDVSLWHGLEIIGTFTPSQTNLSRIIDVIKNDIPKLTNNFVSNPIIERESNNDPLPIGGIDAEGYVIIRFRKDLHGRVLTSHDHSNFDIYNGLVSIPASEPDIPRVCFSQDICEPMGYVDLLQKYSYYSIFCDDENGYISSDYPTAFDTQYINKIKYGRLPGNMSWMDIPDYDPSGSGTSGLLLHKVEPIYELNPLNQFNQFQQPTFTPHTKRHIEKREIKDKGK